MHLADASDVMPMPLFTEIINCLRGAGRCSGSILTLAVPVQARRMRNLAPQAVLPLVRGLNPRIRAGLTA